MFHYTLSLGLREYFLFPQNLCDVFSLAELSDYVEIVFCLVYSLKAKQMLGWSVFYLLENVYLVIRKLFVQVILFFYVDYFYSNQFIGLVILSFVNMRAIPKTYFVWKCVWEMLDFFQCNHSIKSMIPFCWNVVDCETYLVFLSHCIIFENIVEIIYLNHII